MNEKILQDFADANKINVKILKAILNNESKCKGFKNGVIKQRMEYAVFLKRVHKYPEKSDADLKKESTSWGIAQIMGYHYEMLGYKTVNDMVNDYMSSEDAQLKSFVEFCKVYRDGKFLDALRNLDIPTIADMYNGSNYKVNAYDVKLKKYLQKT